MGEYAASLICGDGVPDRMVKLGVTEDALAATRPGLGQTA
jgi:D-arginine dehydrogenase